jgi:hypothetical protein
MLSEFNGNRVAILNSRQSLRPLGDDSWIKNSERAVKHAVDKGCNILTSVGMNIWEILLYFASKYRAPVIIYIPTEADMELEQVKQNISHQFNLKSDLVNWRSVEVSSNKKDKHYFQKRRDELIIGDANIIYPISVRRDGNMERLLADRQKSRVEIIDNFRIKYSEASRKYKIEIDRQQINRKIDRFLKGYIIHWTRTSNTNWPGETKYEYFDAVVNSGSVYPRKALATLKKILGDKKIIASSRHYRKNMSAVAFSSLSPGEAVKLMKWRARYREMSFEPYGIAIKQEYAESIGIRKVIYGPAGQYHQLDNKDKPYFQTVGTRGYWLPEKEYRYIADLNLDKIPREYMAAVVQYPDEIEDVKEIFEAQVVSLLDGS